MKSKYCSKCGTECLVYKANFCNSCGAPFNNAIAAKLPTSENEIFADEDGSINLTLAKRTKQIDFEVVVPFEKQDGASLRELMSQSEK